VLRSVLWKHRHLSFLCQCQTKYRRDLRFVSHCRTPHRYTSASKAILTSQSAFMNLLNRPAPRLLPNQCVLSASAEFDSWGVTTRKRSPRRRKCRRARTTQRAHWWRT